MNNISELAKMAANGDRAAFDSLYEQTKSGVWFTCISLLKNEENAKDVMQETYIAAFEKLGTLADFGGIQSWLNKIAANKCKNYIRTISNSHMADNGEELLENIPDDKLIPEEYVTDMAKRRIIMDIIERSLSEEQYRTIILYYFDEMTAAEIAELMDCHEKTVLYRLKTARSKIKEEVMRYEEENKDKLHAVVFVPLLTQLLRLEAENTSVPNVPIKFQAPPSTQNNVPSNAAVSSAQQGGKTMLNSLKAKVIAGACAAVVVGGGVTAGVLISNNSKNNATSIPAVSAPANVSKPTDISKPTNASVPANTSSKPDESSQNNGGSATSKPASEPTVSQVDPISPTGEVQWELVSTAPAEDFEISRDTPDGALNEGEVRIVKYNGNAEYVKIPEIIDGQKVVLLNGFIAKDNLKGVYIPDGVTEIGFLCFSDNENLKYIRFPETLEKLQPHAFADCLSLESVTLPQSTKILMKNSFATCKNLKKVVVPDSIEEMGVSPILNCPDCELHYRGHIFNNDDCYGMKLENGVLTVDRKKIPVEDLDQVLGGAGN